MITLGDDEYMSRDTKGKSGSYLWSGKEIWRRIWEGRSKYSTQTIVDSTPMILSYSYEVMRA